MNDLEIAVVPQDDEENFRTILKEQNIEYSERTFLRSTGEYDVIATLFIIATTLGRPAIHAIGNWAVARQGRKVRVKISNIDAEAGSVAELKELLALVHKQSAEHAKREDEGKNPPGC